MRKMLLTTAALFGAAFAVSAFAQTAATPQYSDTAPETAPAPAPRHVWPHHHAARVAATPMSDTGARPGHEPGVGESYPASNNASNINGSDSRSQVAPRLPTPAGGDSASPQAYLRDAQSALSQRRTGAAQEALERAETAFLNNPSNPADPTSGPVGGPMQQTTEQARQALGSGNLAQARQLVDQALAQGGGGQMGGSIRAAARWAAARWAGLSGYGQPGRSHGRLADDGAGRAGSPSGM